jgi:thioredoxin-dependent peroxiredoxin
MAERNDVIKIQGNPVTLIGNEIKVGDKAPNFTVLDSALKPVKLSDFKGKTVVIASVTSLDTGTCDLETKRFNKEAANLGDDVVILTLSMDLPFAQARWCGAAGVENVKVYSDYRDASFGNAYGVLIKELRLLARVVFVIDPDGTVKYIQYAHENSKEPNYDDVLDALKEVVG